MSLAHELAAWAADLRLDDVPPAARAAACRHMLDGVGTALAAIRTGASAPALKMAQGISNTSDGRLLGSEEVPSQTAAFGMAAAVHALDFDDTHAYALIHPTAVILPVAIAVGRELGCSGPEVLEAALVGYEVGCRLGAATPFGFHSAGVHATSAVGVVAAASVASKLQSLNTTQFSHALAVAASVSGGLLESLGTGTKQLHPAFAVSNGILAARLAAAGADGAATAFEGKHGLFATHSRREANLDTVTEGFGTRWEVTQISLKPYPCCQLMHSALDAAYALRPELCSAAADIATIDVYAHPDSLSIVGKTKRPRDPNDAKFSLAWSVAALLVDGAVTVDTYSPQVITRDDIARLATKVETHEFASVEVAANAGARIVIHLDGGAIAEASVPRSKGTPEQPMSLEDLREKFYRNCGDASDCAVRVADWVLGLESQGKVDDLLRLTDDILAT